MRTRLLLGLAVISIAFAVSCMRTSSTGAALVYCSEGSPESLNPQQVLSGTGRSATATTIYDRLIDFKQGTTELAPALAESWTISNDHTVYDFTLRRGVKFQTTEF